MAVRHADASGGDIRETQHEEDRMRDIHVGKRGPQTAGEEQLDKLRKTVRFEQEASNATASPIHMLLWNILRTVRHQVGRGPHLCRSQVMLDALYEMDGRKSRHIGEVLEWYRGEDAGDLKRSELNEMVENLTCLDALEGENLEKWSEDRDG